MLLVQCGMTSFSLNFFSNQIQCSHIFLIIQFPELSNLKNSILLHETRDFPCIAVFTANSKSAPPIFLSALVTTFSFVHSRAINMRFRVCSRASQMRTHVPGHNQSIAWYACEAPLGKKRYVRLNGWKTQRSVWSCAFH